MVTSERMLRALTIVALFAGGCDEMPPPVRPVGTTPLGEPPAHTVGGFRITLPPMTLAPGQERHACWVFPLQRTGPSRIVGGAVLRTMPGMHHGNITTRPRTGDGVRSCITTIQWKAFSTEALSLNGNDTRNEIALLVTR